MRIATFHSELTRKGPGLLLRDLGKPDDPQISAIAALLAHQRADILLLTKVDMDAGGRTLAALQARFGYAHGLAVMPNSNRRIGARRAAWAPFAGAGGMALLSQEPIMRAQHDNDVLWRDLPFADLPLREDGTPFYSDEELAELPLVTQGLWRAEIGGITFVLFHNQTPVFDGPEDRNGKRNRDQLRLIEQTLDALEPPFVVMGNSNLDPNAGDGDRAAMRAFLARHELRDPKPESEAGGVNTAFWERPGPMRVSYVVPSGDLRVAGTGVLWPSEGPLREAAERASRHRLVWLDITR